MEEWGANRTPWCSVWKASASSFLNASFTYTVSRSTDKESILNLRKRPVVDDRSQSGPAGPLEAAPQAGDTMFCGRIVSWTQVRQGISFGILGFLGDHPSCIPQLEGSTPGGVGNGEARFFAQAGGTIKSANLKTKSRTKSKKISDN